MKRMLCIAALTALLALGLVPFAGALAEEGVVVDDVFKITFITAEFNDNWTEYTGERVTASATTNPHYGLRIYVLDPAASSSSDLLSERMRGWVT